MGHRTLGQISMHAFMQHGGWQDQRGQGGSGTQWDMTACDHGPWAQQLMGTHLR
jgi:hypothetical protein